MINLKLFRKGITPAHLSYRQEAKKVSKRNGHYILLLWLEQLLACTIVFLYRNMQLNVEKYTFILWNFYSFMSFSSFTQYAICEHKIASRQFFNLQHPFCFFFLSFNFKLLSSDKLTHLKTNLWKYSIIMINI